MFASVFGLRGMAIAGAVAFVLGTGIGWKTRDAFCDAAAARADLASEKAAHAQTKLDLDAARLSAEAGKTALEAIQNGADRREETIRALESQLAAAPAAAVDCRLGADGLRRLRAVAPD